MKVPFNPLLQRQIRKHLGDLQDIPEAWMPLLAAVSESYVHYDNDRKLMDRAMELSSAELMDKNRDLQHKNEMLDAFVYRVSHDFKAPINNLLALTEMLRELQGPALAANPILEKTVSNISDTAHRMHLRINDLLDLSRIEQSLDAEPETIDLAEMTRTVMHDLQFEIEKSQAVIDMDFMAAPTISGGRENIYSLLSNLLSNAIKYRSAERSPVIEMRTDTTGTHTALTIKDNGMGIDLAKHRAKLFGMFNRFHSHVPGTGVGLFIIKKIIERSGGTIEVDSTVGIGTTFYVRFRNATRG